MAVYRANRTQHEYTVWPVQSAGGAIHCVARSECGCAIHCVARSEWCNIQNGGAIHTHCVASSECRWRYTHTVWPVQSAVRFRLVALYRHFVASSVCCNIQTGGAIHTLCGQFRVL